jgi:hypothetical protein
MTLKSTSVSDGNVKSLVLNGPAPRPPPGGSAAVYGGGCDDNMGVSD